MPPVSDLPDLVFPLVLPFALMLTTGLLLVRWPRLHEGTLGRYESRGILGLSDSETARVLGEVRVYLGSAEKRLAIRVTRDGRELPLFGDREIDHMRDVKVLLDRLGRLDAVLIVFLAGFVIHAAARFPRRGRTLGWLLVSAAMLTAAFLIGSGSLLVFDFSELFRTFHEGLFEGESWILDASDPLILLYPHPFWIHAATLLAGLTLVEGLLVGAAGMVLLARTPPDASDPAFFRTAGRSRAPGA